MKFKEIYIEMMMEEYIKKKGSLCVIYNPDCGCPVDEFVILDRFPMSEKIHNLCKVCGKGVLEEISKPIKFHLPMFEKDYSIEELSGMFITDTWQKEYIQSYIEWYKFLKLIDELENA